MEGGARAEPALRSRWSHKKAPQLAATQNSTQISSNSRQLLRSDFSAGAGRGNDPPCPAASEQELCEVLSLLPESGNAKAQPAHRIWDVSPSWCVVASSSLRCSPLKRRFQRAWQWTYMPQQPSSISGSRKNGHMSHNRSTSLLKHMHFTAIARACCGLSGSGPASVSCLLPYTLSLV